MGDIMAACKEAKIGMESLVMAPQVGGEGASWRGRLGRFGEGRGVGWFKNL